MQSVHILLLFLFFGPMAHGQSSGLLDPQSTKGRSFSVHLSGYDRALTRLRHSPPHPQVYGERSAAQRGTLTPSKIPGAVSTAIKSVNGGSERLQKGLNALNSALKIFSDPNTSKNDRARAERFIRHYGPRLVKIGIVHGQTFDRLKPWKKEIKKWKKAGKLTDPPKLPKLAAVKIPERVAQFRSAIFTGMTSHWYAVPKDRMDRTLKDTREAKAVTGKGRRPGVRDVPEIDIPGSTN